jgi:hypothetical protein
MHYRLRTLLIVLAVVFGALFFGYAAWYGRHDAMQWLEKHLLP